MGLYHNGNNLSLALLGLCICLIGMSESKPMQQHEQQQVVMDDVDVCIFTCDFCYKGDVLVKCANECIALEGMVSAHFRQICPYFGPPAEGHWMNKPGEMMTHK